MSAHNRVYQRSREGHAVMGRLLSMPHLTGAAGGIQVAPDFGVPLGVPTDILHQMDDLVFMPDATCSHCFRHMVTQLMLASSHLHLVQELTDSNYIAWFLTLCAFAFGSGETQVTAMAAEFGLTPNFEPISDVNLPTLIPSLPGLRIPDYYAGMFLTASAVELTPFYDQLNSSVTTDNMVIVNLCLFIISECKNLQMLQYYTNHMDNRVRALARAGARFDLHPPLGPNAVDKCSTQIFYPNYLFAQRLQGILNACSAYRRMMMSWLVACANTSTVHHKRRVAYVTVNRYLFAHGMIAFFSIVNFLIPTRSVLLSSPLLAQGGVNIIRYCRAVNTPAAFGMYTELPATSLFFYTVYLKMRVAEYVSRSSLGALGTVGSIVSRAINKKLVNVRADENVSEFYSESTNKSIHDMADSFLRLVQIPKEGGGVEEQMGVLEEEDIV
eukprot:Selendium_serpulae@DN546_c0_g1_i1.p1